ncbi:MAG: NUDIX domain-containing protein [Candidatus Abawacabacteria bacterium]|nr:NUDIX domain-containing protein [Candidatus Abawacabacteria bacterium]
MKPSRKPLEKEERIKVKALCLFHKDGKILASRGINKITNQVFYRLLGGSLNFFETGEAGIRREIKEELHSEIDNLHFIDVVENIFTHEDWRGHELIFLYSGDLVRQELYAQQMIHIVEDTYEFEAEWIAIIEILSGARTLFPALDWKSLLLNISR